ncbi:hypothetical protein [Bacillus sp. WP8]|uniref:hypothetical protein n=1 Tax=Bacillus sp. WP8 TaxID=756828 RepID=UPI000ADC08EE|nr:hypothetical protein [Bacillus sp. WP8]
MLLSIYFHNKASAVQQVLIFMTYPTFFEISSFNLKLSIDGQANPLYYSSCAS